MFLSVEAIVVAPVFNVKPGWQIRGKKSRRDSEQSSQFDAGTKAWRTRGGRRRPGAKIGKYESKLVRSAGRAARFRTGGNR